MTETLADVSIVFETENEQPGHRIRLVDGMEAWLRQTARSRVAEWIIVSTRPPSPEEAAILRRAPARWIEWPEGRYYGLKNRGIREARGRFVALADADVVPADDWLERALEVLENAGPDAALVTGRTRYLPGVFSREMAIAQLPNQEDAPHATTHFLAHNVLLRPSIVNPMLFSGDTIRLGSDTHLAGRLLEAGYRLLYDPSLLTVHNYARRWTEIYRHCLVIGYSYESFGLSTGEPRARLLRDFLGRLRILMERWRILRRPMGLSVWRLPLSFSFFVFYSTALAHGIALAQRGKAEPFAEW
jgi:glycosyltransferase involved in cell wall biosynthesis